MAATKSLVPKSTGSPKLASSVLKVTADGEVTLSKRARQRRRQRQAHQLAKALEQVDGLHCYANSEFRKRRPSQIACNSSKPSTDEWILVKRTRSTLREHIQKRRARAVQARTLVRKAQDLNKKEMIKKPQKSECNAAESSFQRQRSPGCFGPEIGGRVCTPIRPIATQRCPVTPQCTCSCAVHKRMPVASRLGDHDEAKEPVKTPRATPDATLDRSKATINRPENVNKVLHPQKKTCPSKDNVILGVPHQQPMDCSNELHHQAGGVKKFQKESVQETGFHPPIVSQRVLMFEKLAAETPRPKSKHLHQKKSTPKDDELPEVTINMVGKEKLAITPKVSPGRKINSGIAQRISQLQLEAVGRRDYLEIHEEPSSSDELSDTCSAIASDDTMSSTGQAREAFMVTPDQVTQIIQDALARQKENFKFEMEMAMQKMREMHDQQIRALTNHQGETSHRNNADQEESGSGGDEARNVNEQNSGGGPVFPPQSHLSRGAKENEKIKDLESKINTLISAQEVKKTGIPCPYPREWESIPYPAKFNLINFTPFDGKGSPTQHLIYFKSHLGIISGNEPLMVRSFVGTLRGAAFDWYRRLKPGSINSWDDMESLFLTNFFDDDTEISIGALLDEKQKGGETVESFVKRFRNKAMNCRDPISEEFILQTCHNNLSIEVLEVMGTAPSKTWKDLKVRGEQVERFLKRKKAERGQQTANTPRQNLVPQGRGEAQANAVDAKPTFQMQPQQHQRQGQQQPQQKAPQQSQHQWQRPPPKQMPQPRFPKTYAFKDDEVPGIFKYLLNNNKIQLPPIQNQEEAGMTTDPRYCAYHQAIHHPTKACYHLKDKIQALVDAGVITPK